MKKIPYGKTDFKELIEQNCYYVDKTNYLIEIENNRDVLTYLRPRRFGKTLLTSMMFYYYDINSENLFDTLFKDTKIYSNPTPNKNNYYVLRFDFSGMSSIKKESEAKEKFKNNIISGINDFCAHYHLTVTIDNNKDASDLIMAFLDELKFNSNILNKGIYVMIDEYDNFTNAILEENATIFLKVLGKNGFIRDFYAQLKKYRSSIIKRIFITGVCSISLDSMTSGFNISTNISSNPAMPNFNTMTGLTHDEVTKIIKDIPKETQAKILDIMTTNFDGYLFNKNAQDKVFNSTLVMDYLSKYYINNELPEELLDPNLIPTYEQIKNIITIKNNTIYKEVIDTIFEERQITGILKDKFDLKMDITRDDIISLLYYFGYLTIGGTDELMGDLIFKIPNKIIDSIYNKYYLAILQEYNITIIKENLRNAVKEITADGKVEILSNYISNLLESANNDIYKNFNEKSLQLMYYCLLDQFPSFKVIYEYPIQNNYADIMLLKNSPYTKYNIMLELKYIKKSKMQDGKLKAKTNAEIAKEIKEKKEEGIKQLTEYGHNIKLDNLKKYLIIFVTSELKVLEEVA